MEENYVTTAFNVDLAKKVVSGEVNGKIVTENGFDVRILCFDRQSQYPIVGLIGNSTIAAYTTDGNSQSRLESVKHKILIQYSTSEQKFKPGEKVEVNGLEGFFYGLSECGYGIDIPNCGMLWVRNADEIKRLEQKDKAVNFKPFEKVLVRYNDKEHSDIYVCRWIPAIYQHHIVEGKYPHLASGMRWEECVPYAGNEKLAWT